MIVGGGTRTRLLQLAVSGLVVAEGDSIKIERIDAEVGSAVSFEIEVLAVNNGELTMGCPTVEGATVSATVEKVGKGKKDYNVYKYRRKSGCTIRKMVTDSFILRLRLKRSYA